MKKIKGPGIMLFFALFFSGASGPAFAEYVFLKDGAIIEGKILRDRGKQLVLKGRDGKRITLPREKVMRVLYTPLSMAKVYVQKKSGESVIAYQVDEDRDVYVFRMDIRKPVEFSIKRSDVLFIAERNPSGLKGTAGTDRLFLSWYPPYDPMKEYRVYVKTGSGEYKLAGTSKEKSYVLKNLKSNTEYLLKVTGVDKEKNETPPSNELKIATKNMPPEAPEDIKAVKDASGAYKLSWAPSRDADGSVKKYRLYGTADGKRAVIAEMTSPGHAVKDALRYGRIELVAVDDRGDESRPARVYLESGSTVLGFQPGVIIPLGKLGKMAGTGYGGTLALTQRGLLPARLEAGVELGAYYLPGKDLMESKSQDYERFVLAPVFVSAGYVYEITDSFFLRPALSLGGMYIDVPYLDPSGTSKDPKKHLKTFEGALKAGFSAGYKLTKFFTLSGICEYGAIIEKKGPLSFVLLGVGMSYSF